MAGDLQSNVGFGDSLEQMLFADCCAHSESAALASTRAPLARSLATCRIKSDLKALTPTMHISDMCATCRWTPADMIS